MKKLIKKILCLLEIHSFPKRKLIDLLLEQEIKGCKCHGHQVYMDLRRTGCLWCNHIEAEKSLYSGTKMDVPLNKDLMYKNLLVDKISLEDLRFYYNNCVKMNNYDL